MSEQLAGKVAYVTGAASGIGKAIADLYAKEGAKVVIADLKQEAADAAVQEIRSRGGQALGVAFQVAGLLIGAALALFLVLGVFSRAYVKAGRTSGQGLAAGVGVRFIVDLEAGKPTVRLAQVLRVIDALGGEVRITGLGL